MFCCGVTCSKKAAPIFRDDKEALNSAGTNRAIFANRVKFDALCF